MKKFYVGDQVAYEKETKEWLIIKAELNKDGLVDYTIKKVNGRDVGRIETVIAEVLN